MTNDFQYGPTEWQAIQCAFARIGKDADRIGRGGASLRVPIEIEASLYIGLSDAHSDLNRLKAKRLARIESLKALRNQAEIMRDAIDASSDSSGRYGMSMLEAADTYIGWLSYRIDLFENPISSRERITPESNATKVSREYFWRELIEIWCEFGGRQTGDSAVTFLLATTAPVIAALPDGAKDKRRTLTRPAVERWLERRRLERRPDKNRQ